MYIEREDIIRLVIYTVVTAVYLTVFNIVLATDSYMRTTDFALYGSLTIVFSWAILMMIDISSNIGSFSDAWMTIVSIGLGLCIIGFGIYMMFALNKSGIPTTFLNNSWKKGMLVMPILGGAVSNLMIIWLVKQEEVYWWSILTYAAAYIVGVIICAIFSSYYITILVLLYIACGIGGIILGAITIKESLF